MLSGHELAAQPFTLPAGHGEGRWEAADGQSHHSHDIPSLLVVHGQQTPPQLVSGSHDARLYAVPVTRFLKVWPPAIFWLDVGISVCHDSPSSLALRTGQQMDTAQDTRGHTYTACT